MEPKSWSELFWKQNIIEGSLRVCNYFIIISGYPSRWTYYDFFVRYRVLCQSKDIKRSDFRTTCENIITKLIQVKNCLELFLKQFVFSKKKRFLQFYFLNYFFSQDEDKYQFGKTKLFFRAGQVAFMEKMRAGKLRDCGIMIQKHVKGNVLINY